MTEEAIHSAQPITAVLDHKNVLYIPYHPIGRANTTQSSVDLMEIRCDDNEGTNTKLMLGMSYSLYEQHNSLRIYRFDQINFHKRVRSNASIFE